jgi:two-component system, cell cycle sensor histidine kinase and response regulator CckA
MPEPQSALFLRDDLEVALDTAGVGLWSWTVDDKLVRWSALMEQYVGFKPTTFEQTMAAYLAATHPDDRARVETNVDATIIGSSPMRSEHRMIVRGEVRWLETHTRVERDAEGRLLRMLGTVVDITARKEAQLALEDSALTLRLISELTSDYVYLGDEADLSCPPVMPHVIAGSFERIVGFTRDEVKARGGWFSLFHPDDLGKSEAINRAIQQGQPLVAEYRIIDKVGETRWLRDSIRPVMKDGKLVRITGGVKEITREKQLEEQWLQAQKLEALARLAGGIAHDFNNVLAVIHSGIDVVVHRAGVGHDEVLNDVRDATERAAELTRGLLSFARKPLGSPQVLSMESELTGLRSVLVRSLSERHALRFELESSGLAVRLEPGQLQVLMLNLVINAKDAMPDGGTVNVSARAQQLESTDRRRPAHLPPGRYFVIEVNDTGCGMNASVLSHLFEPFFSTKGMRGTGLGLATCHGIAVRAGGGLTVHSVQGKGSTFWVVLPIADEHPAAPPLVQLSIGGVERLLLVEDEPGLRRIAHRALMDRGYTVVEVGSAEEALALPEDQLARFALVVSDVGLPGLNGITLVRQLLTRFPRLKVLLTSGYLPDAEAEAALDRGDLQLLPKPFSAEGLARRVREVLDG